jgi:hypothetical protein
MVFHSACPAFAQDDEGVIRHRNLNPVAPGAPHLKAGNSVVSEPEDPVDVLLGRTEEHIPGHQGRRR